MKRPSSALRNTATVSMFTACSRVLGLVREMLQARVIGAGAEQSAFTIAFAIPNMARKLFGEGALTAAFVPVFKGEAKREGLEKAARLARAVMTMTLMMLGAGVLLAMSGLECVEAFRARLGLSDRALLTLGLVKTMLPYMIFICGAAFGMGVLNALGRFKAAAMMPCLLNVFWIAALAVLCFRPSMPLDTRIRCVAAAILVAGAFQMAFMLWRMRQCGVRPHLSFSGWHEEKVRQVWRNTAIAALGAGAVQVNSLLDQALAYIASPWAAGVIGYSERLMDLPLGVIGVAFGTVLLPTFADHFAQNDADGARDVFVSSTKNLLFVMVPAAVGLGVLAPQIVDVVYVGSAFDSAAAVRVSRAVACYAAGLAFFGLQKSLVPWFQAQNDMKTPLRTTLATVALNAVLNIAAVATLPEEWRHVGLAASTVICAGAGCVILATAGVRRNGSLGLLRLTPSIARICAAAAIMGGALALARAQWCAFAASGEWAAKIPHTAVLACMIALGGIVYFAAAALLLPGAWRTALRRRRR